MTDRFCETCRWQRRRATPSQVLQRLDSPLVDTFGQALEEIQSWHDQEKAREDALLEGRSRFGYLDAASWDEEPLAHDFCARPEQGGRPGMTELINVDLRCPSHSLGPTASHSCGTCRFLTYPQTPVLNAARGSEQSDLVFFQASERVLESMVKNETVMAVKLRGELNFRPTHLPICERLSEGRKYVVGPIYNGAEHCQFWQATD